MNHLSPKISVIIPVYNCEETISKCLLSLKVQYYQPYEIIVVDDGSTDDTAKICQSFNHIKLIRITNGGPSRARNIGAKEAKGDILAFTDGDCVLHSRWLQELCRGFTSDTVAGVGGNQLSPSDESNFGKYVQETFIILGFATSYMKARSTMDEIRHNPSCNSSYRKDYFEEVGGFDDSLWPGEDVDLDYRLYQHGYTLMRNPQAIVKHYRPQSLSELGGMMRRYGGSAYKLLMRYGFFRPLHYIPFILLFSLFGLIITPITPLLKVVCVALTILALCVFFLAAKGVSKKTAIIVFLSLVILVNWNIGFFMQPFTSFSTKRKNTET